MVFENYKPEWLEMLRTQEETLRVEKMDAEDALKLGLSMVRLAKEQYKRPVSIRVIVGGQTTFSYLMDGTDIYNEWWMDKKLNVSRVSTYSSIRTLVEIAMKQCEAAPEFENEHNYALCGGCFPLKTPSGKLLGFVESSGMHHEEDHQLIADALAELLGKEIPRITE